MLIDMTTKFIIFLVIALAIASLQWQYSIFALETVSGLVMASQMTNFWSSSAYLHRADIPCMCHHARLLSGAGTQGVWVPTESDHQTFA